MSARGQSGSGGYTGTVSGSAPGASPGAILNGVDFYCYPIEIGALIPGAVFNGQIQVQQSMDFEWVQTTFFATFDGSDPGSDVEDQYVNVTIQITDSIGNVMFNQPVPISCIAGSGQRPFYLPISKFFPANSTISFLLTNIDAAITYDNVWVSLNGRRHFQYTANG